jgi:hypothetical protein
MTKRNIKLLSLTLLVCVATIANAESPDASPEAETLYFKALPYLDKIDEINNEIFNIRDQLPNEEKFPEKKKEELINELRTLVAEAVPLLKRSAADGNPAAQYRLARLAIGIEPREQAVGQVCSLLKSSLTQGFAPAGMQMISYCFDDVKTAEFRSLIDALPENTTSQSKYYPQPMLMPSCDRDSDSRRKNAIASLNEKAIRAELYMSLSTQISGQNLKQEKIRYLQKAANYGCRRAIERLKLIDDVRDVNVVP